MEILPPLQSIVFDAAVYLWVKQFTVREMHLSAPAVRRNSKSLKAKTKKGSDKRVRHSVEQLKTTTR